MEGRFLPSEVESREKVCTAVSFNSTCTLYFFKLSFFSFLLLLFLQIGVDQGNAGCARGGGLHEKLAGREQAHHDEETRDEGRESGKNFPEDKSLWHGSACEYSIHTAR